MDDKTRKILSTGGVIAAALMVLLGGLAVVLRSLGSAELQLELRTRQEEPGAADRVL